jgi:hypothetical protein
MKTPQPAASAFPLDEYSRRATRSWWADGFWDLAMAGFWLLAALWLYPLVRTMDFPSWTWPWPFLTGETVNPLSREITLWFVIMLGVWIVYIVAAKLIIDCLKRKITAPRLGDVRHDFFLPVGKGFALLFLAVYVLGCVFLAGVFWKLLGGPHLFSAIGIAAFAGVLFLLGRKFSIRRYQWVSVIGMILCILAEMLTTAADYLKGPQNFMEASPLYGNPSLICLVWAGVLAISGVIALRSVLRLPHAEA